ncbi:MFS transporter [Methylocystis echinoides]|uniref:Metabolite transport protein n=1 Tax=Methylocystis echinoides TaxID=29468 RepID=A0A9W6GVF8_9HYPH|nr:MFS transporter [Methylocystis echinoides]GLI93752.1 putative metabolite transport protein [Methylocystis echinoides]
MPASPSHVSPVARRALLAATVGYAMDGFDLLILSFMLEPISADLGLDRAQAAGLVTWTLIGAVGGGLLFGVLSDRYGRVRVLSWSILVFALFTGLCAFARGYGDLLLYRTLAGFGLGGEFGLGMALVAETWPAGMRARACSYVGLGWQAGVLMAALLAPALLPHIGWRGVFLVGVIPSLVAFVIRRHVEEPEIFRAAAQGRDLAAPLRLLVADAATTRASLGMVILCAVQNFGYYGLMVWLPTYLSSQFGFSLSKSALWTIVTVAGMAAGVLVFGHMADRYGRRPAFVTFQFGAFSMVLLYAQLSDPWALLVAGAVMGLFVNGMIGGYGALLSELYPTEARATAENVLFNIGRGIGGWGPVVIAALAARYSFGHAIALLAGIYLVDIAATLLLIPERRGVALH